jgi:hypothetical protein
MTTSTPLEAPPPQTDATNSLRMLMRRGRVATAGAIPAAGSAAMAVLNAAAGTPPVPPRPGVFSGDAASPLASPSPAAPAAAPVVPSASERLRRLTVQAAPALPPAGRAAPALEQEPLKAQEQALLTASERLRQMGEAQAQEAQVRKQASEDGRTLAAMRTLTVLLCAVYARPGSSAKELERMQALATLSERSQSLGRVLAQAVGDDVDRNRYVQAVAMEAAVALAAREWADGREVRWEELIVSSADRPEIGAAAQAMAASVYRPVQTEADAQDRVRISLHAAFWQLYELGQDIDGITPVTAASIISDVSEYLREHEKPVSHPDLQTAWVQGSVRRMTDLVCAEMKARFVGQDAPTAQDIEEVLAVARAGFEGVESYAQHILAPRAPSPGPVDSP